MGPWDLRQGVDSGTLGSRGADIGDDTQARIPRPIGVGTPMSMPSTALPGSACMQKSNIVYAEALCPAKTSRTAPASNHLLTAKGSKLPPGQAVSSGSSVPRLYSAHLQKATSDHLLHAKVDALKQLQAGTVQKETTTTQHLHEASTLSACIPESLCPAGRNS